MAGSTPAAVLLNEPFDYADGSLVTVSDGAWQTFSGTAGQITVAAGRASLNLADGEDVQALLSPPPATGVVCAGFTLRFSTLPPGGGSYFALFKDTGTSSGFRARVWALTNGAAGGKFRVGLSSTAAGLNATYPADLSLNTDYRVVVRLTNATGTATLWLNPVAESDPSITTTESVASSTVTVFALRQGGDKGLLTVDNLLVGESFAEVVSTNAPPSEPPLPTPAFSVLTYNTHGNSAADWSTNAEQVQAIGRQVMYLDPDIITFQEIPMTNAGWAKLPEFVAAFRPGFQLATNSSDDGYIRSAILSRFPINRSQSWLHWTDLKPFGYTNTSSSLADNFTRDLFEAEIAVPGFERPLHVFTAHLKSGDTSSDAAAKRAAEAAAISNYLAQVFLPAHPDDPYLLTGDMNEDIARPATGSQQPIQRLANDVTGLWLTSPVNPVTASELTFSIQAGGGPSKRYDYILPCGLLFSNYAGGKVFRSDLLTNPPGPLLADDDVTASDHLPVLLRFANPYAQPFRLLAAAVDAGQVALRWESHSNRVYGVEASGDLKSWTTLATNLVASGTNLTFVTNAGFGPQFFRVYREP